MKGVNLSRILKLLHQLKQIHQLAPLSLQGLPRETFVRNAVKESVQLAFLFPQLPLLLVQITL